MVAGKLDGAAYMVGRRRDGCLIPRIDSFFSITSWVRFAVEYSAGLDSPEIRAPAGTERNRGHVASSFLSYDAVSFEGCEGPNVGSG
jgi:hypothetical protein